MEIKEQNKLAFLGVEFINVNFNSIAKVSKGIPEINVNVEPRLFLPKDNNTDFHILMRVSVDSEDFFELSLVAIGSFSVVGKKVSEETRQGFINENAPAIMFPYVRSFISTFTSNLGDVTGRIQIPTQFFKGDLQKLESSEQNVPTLDEPEPDVSPS